LCVYAHARAVVCVYVRAHVRVSLCT